MAEEAFQYSGEELDALAHARNYYAALIDDFRPYIGADIVEVGAGTGTFAEYLRAAKPAARLTLIEPASNNFPLLHRRFADDERSVLRQGYFEDFVADLRPDTVVVVNVIEHIADDAGFATSVANVLQPGGHLLIYVPALPILFGSLDREFEHHRRYTKATLRAALGPSGLEEVSVGYRNMPGVLSWFVAGRILRKTTIKASEVQLYDRLVMPWVRRMDRLVAPPVGQNLLAVFRKGG